MNFNVINCIKTCQREQVNKFSQQFLVAKCRKNNFSTVFFEVLRGGWETGKELMFYKTIEPNNIKEISDFRRFQMENLIKRKISLKQERI